MAVQTRSFNIQSMQNSQSMQDSIEELENIFDGLTNDMILHVATEIFVQFPSTAEEHKEMSKQLENRKIEIPSNKTIRLPKRNRNTA